MHTEWSDGWGGQERRIVSEMVGMQARGHELALLCRPHCLIRGHAERAGIETFCLPMRGSADISSILQMAWWLRHRRTEVVNTHSGVDTWIGSLAAKLARTPALVRTRHLDLPLKRTAANFVHFLPDRVITCGERTRKRLIEDCGFPATTVVSVPTGIDFEIFMPTAAPAVIRGRLGFTAEERLILMVGVIRGVKRHEVALRAFEILTRKEPSARLLIAGDGPMLEDMKALATHLNIAPHVQFLGFRDDVADLMAAADVLLLTSRSEGVPQAITQAMGLGLPVIATEVGGVPELISHGETGVLVPPENPEAAAAGLLRLLSDIDLARRLATAAKQRARSRHSVRAMLDNVERVYRDIATEKGRTPR